MPMQMGFRWYGEGNDKISLNYIKQIPGVTSIVWALHNKMPGEIWEVEEIAEVQKQLEPYGFNMDVVESVNVHDDIKIGLPTCDQYIENYIQTIRNLSKFLSKTGHRSQNLPITSQFHALRNQNSGAIIPPRLDEAQPLPSHKFQTLHTQFWRYLYYEEHFC